MMNPLDWVDEYAAQCEDVPSFRHMHCFITEAQKRDAELRSGVVSVVGEITAKRYWDDEHQIKLDARRVEALATIERRLKELGASI
jgi:hypothetical protein